MQFSRFFLFTGALVATACADGSSAVSIAKGEIDTATVADGITLRVADGVGTVSVPMMQPVPDTSDSALTAELGGATSLIVENPGSGVTADLADGTYVEGEPSQPGQYTWSLNADRDQVIFTFFNETTGGLQLDVGTKYKATLSVSSNAYIDEVDALAFMVKVEG